MFEPSCIMRGIAAQMAASLDGGIPSVNYRVILQGLLQSWLEKDDHWKSPLDTASMALYRYNPGVILREIAKHNVLYLATAKLEEGHIQELKRFVEACNVGKHPFGRDLVLFDHYRSEMGGIIVEGAMDHFGKSTHHDFWKDVLKVTVPVQMLATENQRMAVGQLCGPE